jgi:hypothetical protein
VFDRLCGLIVYFALIATASGAVMTIGERFARLAAFPREQETTAHVSRVTVGLEAQKRSELWQPVSYTFVKPDKEPPISVTALAHNLDQAESLEPPPAPASRRIVLVQTHRTIHPAKRSRRARRPLAHRAAEPRHRAPDNLTTAQIILRSLTSDL